MWTKIVAAACFASIAIGNAAEAKSVSLDNSPASEVVGELGPLTPTFGEVFTAPVSGEFTSFMLTLEDGPGVSYGGGVDALFGGVGVWNGSATYKPDGGVSSTLYQSGLVPSLYGGALMFVPDVTVNAGNQYVAYVSVYSYAESNSYAFVDASTRDVANIDFLVSTTGSPQATSGFYGVAGLNLEFVATFDPTVSGAAEPSVWLLMLAGIGLVGGALRSHKSAKALGRFA